MDDFNCGELENAENAASASASSSSSLHECFINANVPAAASASSIPNTFDEAKEMIRDLEARLENVQTNHEEALGAIEMEYVRMVEQKTCMQSEIEQYQEEIKQHQKERLKWQKQSDKQHQMVLEMREQLAEAKTETMNTKKHASMLVETNETLHKQVDKKEMEIREMYQVRAKLNAALTKAEHRVHKYEAERVPMEFQVEKLQQQLSIASQHTDWLETQIETKANDILHLKKLHATERSKLETQISALDSDKIMLQQSSDFAAKQVSELLKSSAITAEKIRDLELQLAKANERYDVDLGAQLKLNSLYKQSLDEEKKHGLDLEQQLHAARTRLSEYELQTEEEIFSYKERIGVLETELKLTNEQLQAEIESKSRFNKESEDNDRDLSFLSPVKLNFTSFSNANETFSSFFRSPFSGNTALESPSSTQLQESNVNVSLASATFAKLIQMQQEHKQLEKQFRDACFFIDQLQEELRLRAPQLSQNQQQFEDALASNERLTSQLDSVRHDVSELQSKLSHSEQERAAAQCRADQLTQECNDLARQVRSLLLATSGRTNLTATRRYSLGVTHDMVSEQLVSVQSISDMQEKNQSLLREVRKLKMAIERLQDEHNNASEDGEPVTDDRRSRLDEAYAIIQELQDNNSRLQSQVDTLSQSIAHNEQTASSSTPSTPSFSIEAYQDELQGLRHQLAVLRDDKIQVEEHLQVELQTLRCQTSELRVTLARAQAEASFAQEKLSLETTASASLRQELDTIRFKHAEVTSQLHLAQQALTQARTDLLAVEQSSNFDKQQAAQTSKQIEILRNTVSRLEQECQTLRSTCSEKQEELDNLQDFKQILQSKDDTGKERLLKELDEERKNSREQTLVLLKRVEDATIRAEKASEQSHQSRVEAIHLQNKLDHALQRCADLQHELSNRKLQVGASTRSHFETADIVAVRDSELNEQLATSQMQLNQLRQELQETQQCLVDARKDAANSDQSLKQVIASGEQYKLSSENELIVLRAERDSLAQRVEHLQEVLKNQTKESELRSTETTNAALYNLRIQFTEQSRMRLQQVNEREQQYNNQIQMLEKRLHQLMFACKKASNLLHAQSLQIEQLKEQLLKARSQISLRPAAAESAEKRLVSDNNQNVCKMNTATARSANDVSVISGNRISADQPLFSEQSDVVTSSVPSAAVVNMESTDDHFTSQPSSVSTGAVVNMESTDDHFTSQPSSVSTDAVVNMEGTDDHSTLQPSSLSTGAVVNMEGTDDHSTSQPSSLSTGAVVNMEGTDDHSTSQPSSLSTGAVVNMEGTDDHSTSQPSSVSTGAVVNMEGTVDHSTSQPSSLSTGAVVNMENTDDHSTSQPSSVSTGAVVNMEGTDDHSTSQPSSLSTGAVVNMEGTDDHSTSQPSSLSTGAVVNMESTDDHSTSQPSSLSTGAVVNMESTDDHSTSQPSTDSVRLVDNNGNSSFENACSPSILVDVSNKSSDETIASNINNDGVPLIAVEIDVTKHAINDQNTIKVDEEKHE